MFLMQPAAKSAKGPRLPVSSGYRLLFSVMAAGLLPVSLCLVLLWTNDYSLDHQLEGTVVVLISWIALSLSARETFIHSIRVLTNVVGSLKEEDFSVRATKAAP